MAVARVLWLALLSWVALPAVARAQAPAARVAPPIDVSLMVARGSGWVSRVRGQLSDLPVRVRQTPLPPPVGPLQRARLARELASSVGSDLVAWIETDSVPPAGWTRRPLRGSFVVVWMQPSGETQARRLGDAWPRLVPLDRSAALEVAALAVRSAVRSLLLERAALAAAPPKPEPAAVTPSAPESPDRPSPEAWTALGLGGQSNGQSRWGSPSLTAGLGVAWGSWSSSFEARLGLPTTLRVGETSVVLRQHAISVALARRLASSAGLAFGWLARAGVALTHRSAKPSAPSVRVTGSNVHLGPLFGTGPFADWEVIQGQQLQLQLMVEWYPTAPTYLELRTSSAEAHAEPLWHVQPLLRLEWVSYW